MVTRKAQFARSALAAVRCNDHVPGNINLASFGLEAAVFQTVANLEPLGGMSLGCGFLQSVLHGLRELEGITVQLFPVDSFETQLM